MRAFLGKQIRALWEIAFVVFGPAKNAPRVLSWWPIVVAVLGVALPVIGLSVPGDFAFDAVWWVVIALAVLVLLCFRALWILHDAVAREFPRAAITDLVPREDRVPERPIFQGFGAARVRTALQRACSAAGVPTFSRTICVIAA